MNNYTPLHVHTEYSLLDGLSTCDAVANRLQKIGSQACSITDHGSLSGAVDFSKEMHEKSLKPLLGCEMYICKASATQHDKDNKNCDHQVIIAKNLKGWKDLLQLVSASNHVENFYYKPRVDFDMLAKAGSQKNLISFSGHLGSTLANEIIDDPDWLSKGTRMAKNLETMFGKGNFFIEIQAFNSDLEPQVAKIVEMLREISKKTDIPCVATPDAHYCEPEQVDDQHVLLCTLFRKTIGEAKREVKQGIANNTLTSFMKSDRYHIPTYEELAQFNTEEELANTNLIADMCEDYSILNPPNPPEFKCPDNMKPADYLRKLCRDGWVKKMGHITKDTEQFNVYGERVNHELDIFTSIGLSSYFLIVDDILRFVRSQGYITGPGRGSAAGCLVSNLLGITQIDPIPYNLLFERFYNAGRNSPGKVSWPDIDFDIPKAAREETIKYIRRKYGDENVAQIITFQTLKGKAALKRVMSARGNITASEQNAVTKCLLDESKVSDELKDIEEEYGYSSSIIWALENRVDDLKEWCYLKDGKLEGRLAKIFEQAIRLEHTKIIAGKHAAGIVISNDPISNYCPMVLNKKDNTLSAGFEGPSCEDVGLLKLDCLAIRGLDTVMDTINIIGGNDEYD